jgi:hypothetical protein
MASAVEGQGSKLAVVSRGRGRRAPVNTKGKERTLPETRAQLVDLMRHEAVKKTVKTAMRTSEVGGEDRRLKD